MLLLLACTSPDSADTDSDAPGVEPDRAHAVTMTILNPAIVARIRAETGENPVVIPKPR